MKEKKFYLVKCTICTDPRMLNHIFNFRKKIKIKRKNGEKFSLNQVIEYFLNTEKIRIPKKFLGKSVFFKKIQLKKFIKSEQFRSINFDIYKV